MTAAALARATRTEADLVIEGLARAVGLIDHEPCEHPDCTQVVCYCRDQVCPDAVAPGCGHLNTLCPEHATAECDDCLADFSAHTWGGQR